MEPRAAMDCWTESLRGVQALFAQSGLRWAVMGGMAANHYRSQTRLSDDIDILVSLSEMDMDAVVNMAARQGWTLVRRLPDGWFVRLHHERHGMIDVIASEMAYQETALGRAHHTALGDGTEIPILSVEDIVILKLVAARGKDLDDVESILLSDAELDWGYVRKWADEWEVEPLLEQVIDQAERAKRDVEAAGVEGKVGSSASNHSTPSP